MREIEFRAKEWYGDNKFVYGYYEYDEVENIAYIRKDGQRWMVDPHTLGQYVGRDARFNTRMYEGDILLYGCRKKLVAYVDGKFVLVDMEYGTDWITEIPNSYYDFDLAGNIHEK